MPRPLPGALRRSAEDLPFSVFLVTVVLCLFRASDLPSVELSVDLAAGGTELSIGPADVALLATALLAALRLRGRTPLPSPSLLLAAGIFAGLILASSVANGAVAVAAAGKLVEFGALTFGSAVLVNSRARLATLLAVVVGYTCIVTAWAAAEFVGAGGGRQASFVGEHELGALATLALAVGLGRVHARRGSPGALAVAGIVAGVAGVIFGASLASLLGLYLVAAAILLVSRARGDLRLRAAALTVAVAGVATAGTLALRQGELGFLQSWFGEPPERPAQYAASWSQRLIYVYVGGRVFLDRPVLGTGWQGELPPSDFARYVPDARERFPDQPPRYFPRTDKRFIPQQTYDQVLFQLGLIGAAAFAALALLAGRRAVAAVRDMPRTSRRPDAAYVPAAWLASLGGALAGAALFGGSPLTAMFWLMLGVVAAGPAVARAEAARRNRRPLTIVHAIARLNVGGAALHVLQLAREQAARGDNVVVVAGTLAEGETSMEYVATEFGVRLRKLPALQRPLSVRADTAAVLELRSILRALRPEVLHTHTAKAGATGRIAALLAGGARPGAVVHTYHGHVLSGYFDRRWERVFRRIEWLLAHATGTLVAVSDEVRDDLVRLGVARRERFAVVPYGLDLPEWSSADEEARRRIRAELGLADETFAIGWAGRLTAIKRPLDLVRTLRAVLDSEVDAVLVLVGDGEDRPETEMLAHELGVSDRCRFVGFHQRIREWYAAADVSLLTSANEGTPVVAIESLAAERPVVATRAGGTGSVVVEGESGFLLPVGDVEGLARRLAELAGDPELRVRLGKTGAADVRSRYAIGPMADELDAVYRRLLA